ncbi:MAG: MFS transporter [Rickettsiaceae bacterium]
MLSKLNRSILIGNILDHFDVAIYSLLVPILAPLFFPEFDYIVSLILGYSVISSSIITRPLGSIIFGLMVQRIGAIKSLSYSLFGVSISTLLIGLLPTYQSIGFNSTLALITLRSLVGIFGAGESIIASLYILEGKSLEGESRSQAFRISSLYNGSTMFGILLASFASWAVIAHQSWSESQFLKEHLWRVCFIFGGAGGFVGYFLRQTAKECNINSLRDKLSLSLILKQIYQSRYVVYVIAITSGFSYMTYAIPFIVMNSFIPLITNITLPEMMEYNAYLMILDLILIFIIRSIFSNFDIKLILFSSSLILGLTIIPLWYFLPHASILYVMSIRIWIIILGVIFACPLNIWYKKLCNSQSNYLIIGIGSSIGYGFFGKITSAFCLWLWYVTNAPISIAIYFAFFGLISSIVIIKMRSNLSNRINVFS